MTAKVPALYIVADGTSYTLRARGSKIFHKGTLERPLRSFEDRGLLAAEMTTHLKLAQMPTCLQVLPGGALVTAKTLPEGPAQA